MRIKYILVGIVIGALCTAAAVVLAGTDGTLEPVAGPNDTFSYTLEDIYNRLNNGTEGAPSAWAEPVAGPGLTGHTLSEIMAKVPITYTDGATPTHVLTSTTFWGLHSSAWGTQTGAMPDREGDNTSIAQSWASNVSYFTAPDGYYDGDDRVSATDAEVAALDGDLVASNIRCGVTIFGVTGSIPPNCVAKTGQTGCWDTDGNSISCADTGQDGEYQMGCEPAETPSGRLDFGGYNRTSFTCLDGATGFEDNGDGTVTDNLTGLIWLKKANCFGTRNWANALSDVNVLASGSCGLTDGSSAGDWRLPNVNELRSLFDPGLSVPHLPADHPFDGVPSDDYWTSTTNVSNTVTAWNVDLYYGSIGKNGKTDANYVWPVRGGQ